MLVAGLKYIFLFSSVIHEAGFAGFVIFAEVYMLVTLVLFKWSRSGSGMGEMVSNRFKIHI